MSAFREFASRLQRVLLLAERVLEDLDLVQKPMLAIVLDELAAMPPGKELRGAEALPEGEGLARVEALLRRSDWGAPEVVAETITAPGRFTISISLNCWKPYKLSRGGEIWQELSSAAPHISWWAPR